MHRGPSPPPSCLNVGPHLSAACRPVSLRWQTLPESGRRDVDRQPGKLSLPTACPRERSTCRKEGMSPSHRVPYTTRPVVASSLLHLWGFNKSPVVCWPSPDMMCPRLLLLLLNCLCLLLILLAFDSCILALLGVVCAFIALMFSQYVDPFITGKCPSLPPGIVPVLAFASFDTKKVTPGSPSEIVFTG